MNISAFKKKKKKMTKITSSSNVNIYTQRLHQADRQDGNSFIRVRITNESQEYLYPSI